MTLLQAWKDSLSLLKPKHLHLFALVTLKSIVSVYKVLLKYWWWLYAIIIVHSVLLWDKPSIVMDIISLCYPSEIDSNSAHDLWVSIVSYLDKSYSFFLSLLPAAIILSTRSSLQQKNCAYFRRYFIYCLPMIVVINLLPFKTTFLPYLMTLFFFFDSDKQLKQWPISLFRGIKMMVYNWPLFVMIELLSFAVFKLHVYFQWGMWSFIGGAILLPIFICIYMNIYIKKLHDQFDLYFSQPK
jgi:hypothetical protein